MHLGRQRPKSFTDLHFILWDGWIAQDCQFLKCHKACRIGLRPLPTVHLLLHLLPVQWRNQEGFCVGSLGSSCLRHQTTKLCMARLLPGTRPTHHHGLYGNQSTACMDNDISSQLFRISCPNFGNMWILTSSHIIPAQKNIFLKALAQDKHNEPDDHGSLPQRTDSGSVSSRLMQRKCKQ